jgi:hypothetical protein
VPGRSGDSANLRISVIGRGYLGAVHAASMAELGHEVVGVDVDAAKIASLQRGEPPFHEPGFPQLLLDAGPDLGGTPPVVFENCRGNTGLDEGAGDRPVRLRAGLAGRDRGVAQALRRAPF